MPVETQEEATAKIVAQAATATAKAVLEAAQAAAIVVAKDNSATTTAIAVLQTEVTILKNQQITFEAEMNRKLDSLNPQFEKVFAKLEALSEGRPTWSVALILGGLVSICVGLSVYVTTHTVG